MNSWTSHDAQAITSPQEVQVITRRSDGTCHIIKPKP